MIFAYFWLTFCEFLSFFNGFLKKISCETRKICCQTPPCVLEYQRYEKSVERAVLPVCAGYREGGNAVNRLPVRMQGLPSGAAV